MKEQIAQRIAELEQSRQRWVQQLVTAQRQLEEAQAEIAHHTGAIKELKRLLDSQNDTVRQATELLLRTPKLPRPKSVN